MIVNPFFSNPELIKWINCPFSTATQFDDISINNRGFTTPLSPVSIGTTYNAEGALLCDGTNFIVTTDSLVLAANPFEISLDAYVIAGSNTYSVLIAQRINSITEDFALYALNTGMLQLAIRFTDTDVLVLNAAYNRDEWFNVKVKRDASNLFSLSVNGTVLDSATSIKTISNTSGGLFNIANANSATTSGAPTGAIRNLLIYAQ